jgi:hypothetical protein
VADHVEPGTIVITDAWQGYCGIAGLGYVHDRRSQRAARARGDDPNKLLPAVHRVASLAKRWLLGTHQGSVEAGRSGWSSSTLDLQRGQGRGNLFERLALRVDTKKELGEATQDHQ